MHGRRRSSKLIDPAGRFVTWIYSRIYGRIYPFHDLAQPVIPKTVRQRADPAFWEECEVWACHWRKVRAWSYPHSLLTYKEPTVFFMGLLFSNILTSAFFQLISESSQLRTLNKEPDWLCLPPTRGFSRRWSTYSFRCLRPNEPVSSDPAVVLGVVITPVWCKAPFVIHNRQLRESLQSSLWTTYFFAYVLCRNDRAVPTLTLRCALLRVSQFALCFAKVALSITPLSFIAVSQ